MESIWVLHWEYLDKSGNGVLRAYATEERAKFDLDLLEAMDSGKKYEVEELPIYR